MDLNMGFQGLALIQGQIYNPGFEGVGGVKSSVSSLTIAGDGTRYVGRCIKARAALEAVRCLVSKKNRNQATLENQRIILFPRCVLSWFRGKRASYCKTRELFLQNV